MILASGLGRALLRMRRVLRAGVWLGEIGEKGGHQARLRHLEWRDVILHQNTQDLTETSLAVPWLLSKMINLS